MLYYPQTNRQEVYEMTAPKKPPITKSFGYAFEGIFTCIRKERNMKIHCIMAVLVVIAGIILKLFWITCPKWFSSVLYIGMGWVCLMGFPEILNALSPAAFGWLLAGGIIYTVGGIIYALKLPIFNSRHKNFGSHEIFHLFVMGGSVCHFIFMYLYVA